MNWEEAYAQDESKIVAMVSSRTTPLSSTVKAVYRIAYLRAVADMAGVDLLSFLETLRRGNDDDR